MLLPTGPGLWGPCPCHPYPSGTGESPCSMHRAAAHTTATRRCHRCDPWGSPRPGTSHGAAPHASAGDRGKMSSLWASRRCRKTASHMSSSADPQASRTDGPGTPRTPQAFPTRAGNEKRGAMTSTMVSVCEASIGRHAHRHDLVPGGCCVRALQRRRYRTCGRMGRRVLASHEAARRRPRLYPSSAPPHRANFCPVWGRLAGVFFSHTSGESVGWQRSQRRGKRGWVAPAHPRRCVAVSGHH